MSFRVFKLFFFLAYLLRRLWCQLPSVAEVLNDSMLLCEWLLCSECVHLHAAGGDQPFPVTGTCDRRQNEAIQSLWAQPLPWKAADGHTSSHCSWSSEDRLRENRFLPGINTLFLFPCPYALYIQGWGGEGNMNRNVWGTIFMLQWHCWFFVLFCFCFHKHFKATLFLLIYFTIGCSKVTGYFWIAFWFLCPDSVGWRQLISDLKC